MGNTTEKEDLMYIISRLLDLDGTEHDNIDELYHEIETLLYKASAEEVAREFREGGRWYNIENTVNCVKSPDGSEHHFEVSREVNASESQDGQENAWSFRIVFPREVTTIVYE